MHIEGAARRDVEQRFFQHVAVVEGKNEIRFESLDLRDDFRRIGIVRRDHGDVMQGRQLGDAVEPDVFVQVVGVRHHQRNFYAVGKQHRQAAYADVVVGEDDGTG